MGRSYANILMEVFETLNREEQQAFLKIANVAAKEETPEPANQKDSKVPAKISDAELDRIVNQMQF